VDVVGFERKAGEFAPLRMLVEKAEATVVDDDESRAMKARLQKFILIEQILEW